ncbi:hypothetical protein [Rudaea sp.]|uniref:hypothetical protein n=1 Tax=Rudaea sp. TaxID=2136325 RepID=UPI002ED383DB
MIQRIRQFARRRTRLQCVALIVFCLLFNQLAAAAYVCPTRADAAQESTQAMADCDEGMDAKHPARCAEHCNPATASADHAPSPAVPPALLPPTTWLRADARAAQRECRDPAREVIARAAAPPLNIAHCTFQI